MIDLIPPGLDAYIKGAPARARPVLAEMEAYAAKHDVPIVGPPWDPAADLTRSIGADRVFELGSAIGYRPRSSPRRWAEAVRSSHRRRPAKAKQAKGT